MVHKLYATYDGHVLLPEGEVDLLPNHRYLIKIESPQQQRPEPKKNVLQRLSENKYTGKTYDLIDLSNRWNSKKYSS